jgi:hypothetical protein
MYILSGIAIALALGLGLFWILSTIAWGRVRRVDEYEPEVSTDRDGYWVGAPSDRAHSHIQQAAETKQVRPWGRLPRPHSISVAFKN